MINRELIRIKLVQVLYSYLQKGSRNPDACEKELLLSLDKAYSDSEILSWISKTTKNTGENLSFVLEEKLDGFSIVLYYATPEDDREDSAGEAWTNWSYMEAGGFVLITIGVLTYNYVWTFPCFKQPPKEDEE